MSPAVSLLQDLVRLPSINPMGRSWVDDRHLYEFRVTDYLEQFFRDAGLPCERQLVLPNRENIIARYDAGSATTILLEVHQDTVPVEAMKIDPFGGEIRDGKLYGRGACDVKGSMAVMLAVMRRLQRERPNGAANVVLACAVDEEHTFTGIQYLSRILKADMAIVAEPTMLKIVDAHKGVVRWKLRTAGRACHSSAPHQGINAIYRMGRIVQAIEEFNTWLGTRPAQPRLGGPTISVGRIEGGVSVNTVPDDCVIEIDRRLLPGEDPLKAPGELEAFLKQHPAINFPFTLEPIWLACPALNPDGSDALVAKLGRAIDGVIGSHEVIAVPFGTDASTLAEAGIPSVVFGPGDIAQAHTNDEWISLEQLALAEEILYRVVTEQ